MANKKNYFGLTGFIGIALLMFGLVFGNMAVKAADSLPDISYAGHVQNIGWQGKVKNGQTAGTTGKSLRLEALKIDLKRGNLSMIQYRAHVENVGWQSWVSSGSVTGTTGRGYRMEAIQIKLLNEYANQYDIYYRVHVPNYGWLGYAKNGATAGSVGLSQRIEAIQIKLVKKGTIIHGNGASEVTKPTLNYQAHSQNIGWMSSVSERNIAGTTGRSYRLEAVKINLGTVKGNGGITYRAHVSTVGWQGWKTSGQIMGTTGKGKAIEAVELKLTGNISNYFDIYYRMHVSGMGWLGWAKNGEKAGTTGGGIPAEAIQIQLVVKSHTINRLGAAYYDKSQLTQTANNSQNSYARKVSEFTNTLKWRNGTAWGSSKRPTIGNGNGTGCYAYANDFIKYVFGASGDFSSTGKAFYSPSGIRNGDVIKVVGSQHWFVVLYRNGNQLITAEGNWGGKVLVSGSAYTISGNTLYRNGKRFRTFSVGYHYQ